MLEPPGSKNEELKQNEEIQKGKPNE